MTTIKETRWTVIFIFLIVTPVISILQNFVLYKNQSCLNVFRAIAQATNGLVLPTLVCNLLSIAFIIVLLFMIIGELRPKDMGLHGRKILHAVMITALLWLLMNAVFAVASLMVNSSLAWQPSWDTQGVPVVIGKLISHLFGNALYEEAAFRGFLLMQLYLKFSGRQSKITTRKMVLALLISQSYFSLIHIPNRLANNGFHALLFLDLLGLLIMGILFALLFLRTQNLFLVVGCHALLNTPTSLVKSPFNEQILPAVFMILILVFWPYILKRIRNGENKNTSKTGS